MKTEFHRTVNIQERIITHYNYRLNKHNEINYICLIFKLTRAVPEWGRKGQLIENKIFLFLFLSFLLFYRYHRDKLGPKKHPNNKMELRK
mgnify:CR=1 FL=1